MLFFSFLFLLFFFTFPLTAVVLSPIIQVCMYGSVVKSGMAGARNGPSVAAAEAVAAVSTKPSIKLKLNLTILIIDL